jgi:hypothetical protein
MGKGRSHDKWIERGERILVVGGGLMHHSKASGVEEGIRRVGEVLFGCVAGLVVSGPMAKRWPPPERAPAG